MENATKTRILDEALVCFAANGYKGTNLRDLAADMGLSKSALYKYFASKEEIWNAVLDRMEAYYNEHFGTAEKITGIPDSCDELFGMTMQMLDFTMHDEKVILTRKLLLTEQFRDERARRFASLHFLTGTKEIFGKIFASMMEKGLLIEDDPGMLAFAYTSPITLLVHLCDREPEREQEIRRQIEDFIRHFIHTYAKKTERGKTMIEAERLNIRLASDDEMRTLIEAEKDEDLKQAYGEMLSLSITVPENRQWYAVWFIERKNGDRVGDLCFKGLAPDGTVEIGYGILPEYWGKGYATEAVNVMTEWALKQNGVKNVEAETEPSNAASQRVLEKCGFVPTGKNGEEGPRFIRSGI